MPAVPHTADMHGIPHIVKMRAARSKSDTKLFQTGASIARRTHCNMHKKKKPGTVPGF
jgi:hypothetical protein